MFKNDYPACFLCGNRTVEREPISLTAHSISLSFDGILCQNCLDILITNAERITQKLPGPVPNSTFKYRSPFQAFRAQFQASYELIEPKVLLLPAECKAPKEPKPKEIRYVGNCKFCKKLIPYIDHHSKNKTYCNTTCSARDRKNMKCEKTFKQSEELWVPT